MKEIPNYQWKINFLIEGVKLDKQWSKNGLQLTPRVEKRPSWSDKNEILGFCRINTKGDNQNEAEAKAEKIIDGVIASCSIITGMEKLNVRYIVPPQVENEKELKEMGLPVSRSIDPITLYASGDLYTKQLDFSYDFFEKVEAHLKANELKLAMNWYKRAADYEERCDRFIAFWISFNAFYNLYYKKLADARDATKIEYLALNLFDEAEAKQMLTDMTKVISKLASAKGCYLSKSKRKDFANELEQSLKKGNYRFALYYAIRCIYCIRKTLFHGNRDIKEAEKEIADVNPLLKQILRRSMLKYIVGKI
jgi:tetratricopeptide (TPR) repeat protein